MKSLLLRKRLRAVTPWIWTSSAPYSQSTGGTLITLQSMMPYYHVIAPVLAGGETTGIGLNATIYFLCKHPRALEKLREELEELKARSTNKTITEKEAQGCSYLQAIIKETLRLFPVIRPQPSSRRSQRRIHNSRVDSSPKAPSLVSTAELHTPLAPSLVQTQTTFDLSVGWKLGHQPI